MTRPVRIGNIAGLYGDRPSAMREMLDGEVDVITGDWLAELTMLIMARTRQRRPDGGYGRTFVSQVADVMATVLERGVKVVVNAGGLDPIGCADAVLAAAAELGLSPSVAAITGDDLSGRIPALLAAGEAFANLDTGETLGERATSLVTANAYLGGWGIATALEHGADIVVTGRVSDAALVEGAAAWWHSWGRTDWDRLAGGVVAGHVIECSMQATGGNYSFFAEIPALARPGFPWAEVAADGSAVIGMHPGSGGEVSVGTVTSQLLYEIASPEYHNPDVTARFDSIDIAGLGENRVSLSGIVGQPPPRTLKVAAAFDGGFRNSMMIGITGLDARAKAVLFVTQFWADCPWDPDEYEEVRTTLIGTPEEDPSSNAAAVCYLEIAVRDLDQEKVGRSWADSMAHIALGSIPGLFGVWPPRDATPYAVYWPTTIARERVRQMVHVAGEEIVVAETEVASPFTAAVPAMPTTEAPNGETRRAPLGAVFGARSGDKGGNANLGVFATSDEGYAWLASFLTVERLTELLPDLAGYRIERFELPRLRSVNFVVKGLLGAGVSATLRVDPQAKGLGEYLRAKHADIPRALLEEGDQ